MRIESLAYGRTQVSERLRQHLGGSMGKVEEDEDVIRVVDNENF